jgi:hypothetical protein
MPERAFISQGLQVGAEATPGTNVAANKKFVTVGVESGVKVSIVDFTPEGSKFATTVFPGMEWTEFKLNGIGSYSELLWIFSSVLVTPPAPTVVDTSARKWIFAPNSFAADIATTLSMEQGDTVRAQKWAYGLVTDMELKINRQGIALSGQGIGQKMSDGITLTASPTTPPTVPIFGNEIDIFLDPTFGALGTTKLLRVLDATITVGSRFVPVWVMNTANASYVAHVEVNPTTEMKLIVEADTQGMGLLTNLRAGSTNFIRINATSPTLAGASTQFYQMQWDAAIKVKDAAAFSDQNGIYAIEWTFEQVYDAGFGKAMNVSLWNKELTL